MISEIYGNPTGMNIGDMIKHNADPTLVVQYLIVLDFQYGSVKFYDINEGCFTSFSMPYIKRYLQLFKRLS